MLPPSLLNVVNRLEGFTTNLFRLEPNGKSSGYGAQQIIQFDLPSNSVINLRSFKVFFTGALSHTQGVGNSGIRWPRNINSLVERVEVSAGGVQLSQGANYTNVLLAARDALLGTRACPATGHPHIEPTTNSAIKTGDDDATIAGATGSALDDWGVPANAEYAFDQFPGFLESAPPLLDTSLMPDITVRLTLAPNTVLGVTGTAAGGLLESTSAIGFVDGTDSVGTGSSYSLSNVRAMIESVSFADSMYSQMLASQMAAEGFLELPYTTYHQISGSHSNATRFTVATQSLDHIYTCWRNSSTSVTAAGSSGAGVIRKVAGSMPLGVGASTAISASSAVLLDSTQGKFKNPEFVTDYFNFEMPTSLANMQLQLNGTLYPQWLATPSEWLSITKNSLGMLDPDVTQNKYQNNYFCQVSRHNFPESDGRVSNISGIDTRAVNLQGVVNASGATNPYLYIFMQCTSTLRVGQGRSIVPIP